MDTDRKKQAIAHWLAGAADALDTTEKLMSLEKYHHALFFGHLYLEKVIKAYYIQQLNNPPLPIHDLAKLLKKAGLELDTQQAIELKEITSFNMEARYEEDKYAFYKKATQEYAQKWFIKLKEYAQWIKSLIPE